MKTKTWWQVSGSGSFISTVEAVAWTSATITIVCGGLSDCFKTSLIRSSGGDNYFTTYEEAVEHSTKVTAANIGARERLVWA